MNIYQVEGVYDFDSSNCSMYYEITRKDINLNGIELLDEMSSEISIAVKGWEMEYQTNIKEN